MLLDAAGSDSRTKVGHSCFLLSCRFAVSFLMEDNEAVEGGGGKTYLFD